ncbi:hypothetical protein YC2023_067642 [Brassica napus]
MELVRDFNQTKATHHSVLSNDTSERPLLKRLNRRSDNRQYYYEKNLKANFKRDKIPAASWLFWLRGEAVVLWFEVTVGSLGSGRPDFLRYGFPVFAVRVGEIWLVRHYILSEDLFRLVRWSSGSSEWCFGYGGAVSLRFFCGSR